MTEVTLLEIIKSVLPDGTVGDTGCWDVVCEWAPDLFAVMATITEQSGLYSEPTFVSYWSDSFILSKEWIKQTHEAGENWDPPSAPPELVRHLWSELIAKFANAPIADRADAALDWKKIVFQLLAIADQACAGIGFPPKPREPDLEATSSTQENRTDIQYLVLVDYRAWAEKQAASRTPVIGGDLLPYLPHSLCIRVPPAVLCVQPKASTPAVGCTMRSLTHHLALLPSVANVSTQWHIAHKPDEDLEAFNLLVVPFPFSIPGKSFRCDQGSFPGAPKQRTFTIDPGVWVRAATPQDFAEFLLTLIDAADPELEPVHAVVLPEMALKLDFADAVAEILRARSKLDLFVTGVISGPEAKARNSAAIYRFGNGRLLQKSFQSKHHRWGLNESQIRRYHIGHVLDPHCRWWEQIDVSYRGCHAMLFRPRATLSVLICEDLARYDPVLTVMNAIGPNLVIALLMDGPQLEHRWPGRYATVLAEDPGSAVLTVTSLGMVARSMMPGDAQSREIALWKEPNGKARSLKLPHGDHALLLTLTSRLVEQFTLDMRSDGTATVQFGLGAAHGIRHPDPPAWLGRKT
jgi:hypothetical protein